MTASQGSITPVADPVEARSLFRAGLSTPTSGWAPGYTQANMITVPQEFAYDVLLFITRNKKPCPLLDVSDVGSAETSLGEGIDLRTDFPGYRIFENGKMVGEVTDATEVWRDDLVSFLIGCSFTFEDGLVRAGIPVRHLTAGRNVPMYRTGIATEPAGRMAGPMVVSMRAIPAPLVARAFEVTARYPTMHGTPVHVGDPEAIGIANIDAPEYGDPPIIHEGDVPVFWACGVTPQAVVEHAALPFALAHAPGKMLITDIPDDRWASA